ncbi:hypothetical protein BHF71_00935 [Vulcanibacillus modesticaldus]|uniref:N-acetylglucosaminyldiphosphoundecaprenol N-acetyl-beta-D-mannosaminyltransferase n=1 Tax=Vulcanibacillus modesticaldus TaxID=337097 RepID=A0A1D2YVK7_9BACI|nr:WecB/TagA/CpsF family glycosyltransferase [Vulcanibacillus modesticaldus]OEF99772.1 hypothetical protein BHF71_00935 [Vulcanibacillus modesticaldus]
MQEKQLKYRDFPVSVIMDVPFSKLSLTETEEYLTRRILSGKTTHVVTANPEILMYANNSPEYKGILQSADMVVPDGIGVVYASRLRNDPVTERVAGYDLLHRLMSQADQHQLKVYLLGANDEVNRLAFERLANDYPNAIFVGRHHGYFKDGSDIEAMILNDIAEKKPDILFVALGFPRQELWISKHQPQLKIPLVMGVGGSFDVLSGKVKRAPVIWQKLGLEWLYRLISMPSRWRRMMVLPQFLIKEVLRKLKN